MAEAKGETAAASVCSSSGSTKVVLKIKAPGMGSCNVKLQRRRPASIQVAAAARAGAEDNSAKAEQAKGVMAAAPSCQHQSGSGSSILKPALSAPMARWDRRKVRLQLHLAARVSSSPAVSLCPGAAGAR